jgi:hypothetical protein
MAWRCILHRLVLSSIRSRVKVGCSPIRAIQESRSGARFLKKNLDPLGSRFVRFVPLGVAGLRSSRGIRSILLSAIIRTVDPIQSRISDDVISAIRRR